MMRPCSHARGVNPKLRLNAESAFLIVVMLNAGTTSDLSTKTAAKTAAATQICLA